MVLCLFHKNAEEMHVYVVPVTDAGGKPHERIIATDKGPPIRYTLSKTAPTLTVESIALASGVEVEAGQIVMRIV